MTEKWQYDDRGFPVKLGGQACETGQQLWPLLIIPAYM